MAIIRTITGRHGIMKGVKRQLIQSVSQSAAAECLIPYRSITLTLPSDKCLLVNQQAGIVFGIPYAHYYSTAVFDI